MKVEECSEYWLTNMAIVDGRAVMILIVIVTFHDMVRTRAGWPLAFKLIPTPGPTLATALALLPHAIKHHEIKSCSHYTQIPTFPNWRMKQFPEWKCGSTRN